MTTEQPREPSTRSPGSRLLHDLDRATSRPVVAWILVTIDVLWLLFSIVVGFPARLETIFQTLVAALTLAMLFIIQHTQAREQHITQRKLDELLAAVPRADNSLVALEDASDAEVDAIHRDHLRLRDQTAAPARRTPATNGSTDSVLH